mgnify:CR=1 FL=1
MTTSNREQQEEIRKNPEAIRRLPPRQIIRPEDLDENETPPIMEPIDTQKNEQKNEKPSHKPDS